MQADSSRSGSVETNFGCQPVDNDIFEEINKMKIRSKIQKGLSVCASEEVWKINVPGQKLEIYFETHLPYDRSKINCVSFILK